MSERFYTGLAPVIQLPVKQRPAPPETPNRMEYTLTHAPDNKIAQENFRAKVKAGMKAVSKPKPPKDTCPHENRRRQGPEGTKYWRYWRCGRCGDIEVREERLPRGRKREFPKVDPKICHHPLECRAPATKNGKPRERCRACDRVVPIQSSGGRPPKEKETAL